MESNVLYLGDSGHTTRVQTSCPKRNYIGNELLATEAITKETLDHLLKKHNELEMLVSSCELESFNQKLVKK